MKLPAFLLFAAAAPWLAAQPAGIPALAARQVPSLTAFYQELHAHPELSRQEEWTSARLAGELRKAGFTVTEHIGKYADGRPGYGIVALLKNGPGPTVLVRTELDALPIEEKTGLPFASLVRARNAANQEVGVMHACGHDLHMSSFLGTARVLAQIADRWSGTLMMVGQPAEETVEGARAVLADGLYTRFPKPDFVIALHDEPTVEAGKVALRPGPIYASATTLDVTIRGVGGHGAHPEGTKDPVVLAAEYIMALQTIVSRQNRPLQPAVVTVGSIHGGSKNNIIPDEVVLQLTVRAFNEDVRVKMLDSIERMARGIALVGGVPGDRAPIVKVYPNESVPATYNDPDLTARLKRVFVAALGAANVIDDDPIMVSEDFGLFSLDGHQIPSLQFQLGAAFPEKLQESQRTGKPLPTLHSSLFYPQFEPALRTGIVATSSAVLDLLKK
jgi:hippurate hydrolase